MPDFSVNSFRAVKACPVCRATTGAVIATRADNIEVIRCNRCNAGYAALIPEDLADFYDDNYFSRGSQLEGTAGYAFYEKDFSPSSFLWLVSLVRSIEQASGTWLDIGAATGTLIELAKAWGYSVHGVEMNGSAAANASRRGLDVREGPFDPDAWRPNRFRIVSALEVLEHVDDAQAFIRGVESILAVDGLFVFLVPNVPQELVQRHGNGLLDFRKSLEHTVYFEEQSLAWLIESVFGHGSLTLSTFEVGSGSDTASYALGLVHRDASVRERLGLLSKALQAQEVALDGQSAAAVALTLAKFGRHEAATLWLDRARRVGIDDELATVAEAQIARNAGESIAAIRLLDAYLKRTSLGNDHLAGELLRDALTDLMSALCGQRAELPELASLLFDKLSNREAQLEESLRARESSLISQLQSVVAQLDERENELRAQQAQLDDYWRQLRELLDSTAWRVSRPIRIVGSAVKRTREIARALQHSNARRVREGMRLLAKGDLNTLERRMRAISGSPIIDTTYIAATEVVHDLWPMDRPLISVVIPCFNYGHFLCDTVDSVLSQTWTDLEVIVVDAGSTDAATRSVVLGLPARYGPKVRIFLLPQRTLVGAARNYGLSEARGKYVCCLDADDLLHPVYLEMAIFLLERYHYDVASTAIEMFGDKCETVGILPNPTLEDMLQGNHLATAAVMTRSLWLASGGYVDTGIGRDHIYEDWQLWVRLLALGARATNLWRQPLFRYRVHSTASLSQSPGIPDLQHQRRAIANANSDVITDDGIARSKSKATTRYIVTNAFDNLVGRTHKGSDRVVLLAMPFLLIGGAERLLSRVISRLQGRGWQFIVITTSATQAQWGDTTEWFTAAGAKTYHLPRLLDDDQWLDFVSYLVAANGADILWICGSTWMYQALPELKRQHPRLKVVDQLFNLVGHTRDNRRMRFYIDRHLVEDPEILEWLVGQGEPEEKIALIENGVDIDEFSGRLSERRSLVSIGYCGRLAEEKDPLFFLALAEALRDRTELHFSLVGAGPLTEAVRRGIARLRLGGRLTYLGPIDDDAKLREYLAGLDMLVLPSRVDGRPNVVMEAQACGVPVIASAVGAVPRLIIDGESGVLCTPGQLDEFRDAVLRLAGDASLRAKMASSAREHAVQSLSAREMYRRYETLLTELLGEHPL